MDSKGGTIAENRTDELKKIYGRLLEVDSENGLVKCVYCKDVLTLGKDNTTVRHNLATHLLGKRHRRHYITGRIVFSEENLSYEMQWGSGDMNLKKYNEDGVIIEEDGSMFCLFCFCYLPNMARDKRLAVYNIETHLVCKVHCLNQLNYGDSENDLYDLYRNNSKSEESNNSQEIPVAWNFERINVDSRPKYKCTLCKCLVGWSSKGDITLENIAHHIAGRKHKSKMSSDPLEKSERDALDVIVRNDSDISVCLPDRFRKMDGTIFRNSSGRVYCKLCDCFLPVNSTNDVETVAIHIKGKLHRKMFRISQREHSNSVDQSCLSSISKSIVDNVGKKRKLRKKVDNEASLKERSTKVVQANKGKLFLDTNGKVVCKTCSCVISGIDSNVDLEYFRHTKGKRHKKFERYAKSVLESNDPEDIVKLICEEFSQSKVYVRIDKTGYVSCEICIYGFHASTNDSLERNLTNHLKSKRHSKSLQLNSKTNEAIETNDVSELSIATVGFNLKYFSHVNSKRIYEMLIYEELWKKYLYYITRIDHDLVCTLCNEKLPKKNKMIHFVKENHVDLFEILNGFPIDLLMNSRISERINTLVSEGSELLQDLPDSSLDAKQTNETLVDQYLDYIKNICYRTFCVLCKMQVSMKPNKVLKHILKDGHLKKFEVFNEIPENVLKEINDNEIRKIFNGRNLSEELNHYLQAEEIQGTHDSSFESSTDKHESDSAFWVEKVGTSDNKLTQEVVESKTRKQISSHDIALHLSKDFIKKTVHCYYCSLCNTVIPKNEDDLKEHMNDVEHRMYEQNFIKIKSFSYYCILCDVKLTKSDESLKVHLHDETHRSAVLSVNQSNVEFTLNKQFECKTAPLKEITSNQKDTKKMIGCSENLGNTCQDLMKDGIREQEKSYYCVLCNLKIPRCETNLKEHLSGSKHMNQAAGKKHNNMQNPINFSNDKTVLENNYIKVDQLNYSCSVCNLKISKCAKNLDEHLKGRQHKTKLNLMEDVICIQEKEYYCLWCKINIPKCEHNLMEHLQGSNHLMYSKIRSAKGSSLSSENSPESKSNTGSSQDASKTTVKETPVLKNKYIKVGPINYNCVLCNKDITKNEKNLNQHLNCEYHRTKEAAYTNSISQKEPNCLTEVSKTLESVPSNAGSSKVIDACETSSLNETPLLKNKHIQVELFNYNCVLCDVKLTKNEKTLYEHLNCQKHRSKEAAYINSTFQKEPNFTTKATSLSSKNSLQTNSTVSSNTGSTQIDACKTTSVNETPLLKNKHIQVELFNYNCVLCDVLLAKNEKTLNEHLNCKKHRSKEAAYTNSISQKEPNFTTKAIKESSKNSPETNSSVPSNTGSTQIDACKTTSVNETPLLKNKHIQVELFNYNCVLCDVLLAKNEKTLNEHLNCKKHRSKEAAYTNSISQKESNFTTKATKNSLETNSGAPDNTGLTQIDASKRTSVNETPVLKNKHIKVEPKNYNCVLCDVLLAKNEKTLNEHLNCKKHRSKEAAYTISQQELNSTNKATSLECSSNIEHSDSFKVRDVSPIKLNNSDTSMVINECIQVIYKCMICEIEIPKNDLQNHCNEENHKLYLEYFTKNHILVKPLNYHCTMCDQSLPKSFINLISHLEKHPQKLTKNPNTLKSETINIQSQNNEKCVDKNDTKVNGFGKDVTIKFPLNEDIKSCELEFLRNTGCNYYCTLCNEKVSPYEEIINEHFNGKTHKSKAMKETKRSESLASSERNSSMEALRQLGPICLDKPTKDLCIEVMSKSTENVTIQNEFLKDIGSQFYCLLCNSEVPKIEKGFNEHIFGKKHTNKAKEFSKSSQIEHSGSTEVLKHTSLDKSSKDVPLKETTMETVQTSYMKSTTKNTEINSKNYKTYEQGFLRYEGTHFYCFLCSKEIPPVEKNLNEHLNGKYHVSKAIEIAESIAPSESSASQNEVPVCKDTEEDAHGGRNSSTEALRQLGPICLDKPTKDVRKEVMSKSTENVTKQNEFLKDIGSQFYCLLCNSEVPKIEKGLNEHIFGKKHTNKAKEFSKSSQIEHSGSNEVLKHTGLDKPLKDVPLLEAVHTNYVKSTTKNSEINTKNYKTYEQGFLRYEGTHFYCFLCSKEIPPVEKNLNEHLNGKFHVSKAVEIAESIAPSEPNASQNEVHICKDTKEDGHHSGSNEDLKHLDKPTKDVPVFKETSLEAINSLMQTNHVKPISKIPEYNQLQQGFLEDKGTHIYCVLCNTKMPRYQKLLEPRFKYMLCCKYHTNKLISKKEGNSIEQNSNLPDIDESTHHFSCRLCNVTISKNVDILKHLELKHEAYYEENHIEVKSTSYFCKICCIHLPKSYFTVNKHVQSQKHQLYAGIFPRRKVNPKSKIIPDESKDLHFEGVRNVSKVFSEVNLPELSLASKDNTNATLTLNAPEANASASSLWQSRNSTNKSSIERELLEIASKDDKCSIS